MEDVLFGLVGAPIYFAFVGEEWARTMPHYSGLRASAFIVRVVTVVWVLFATLAVTAILVGDKIEPGSLVRLVSGYAFFLVAATWHRRRCLARGNQNA
jgi:hypothetical protein